MIPFPHWYKISYHASDCRAITSQRGSAWQCYIGRWLSIGKPAFFHLSAWKNQWKFKNQFWHRWVRWWDLQTRQIWLRSVYRGRLHTVVKYHTFVTFVLPFFYNFFFLRFLISPTGRNSEPIHTFNSSNDVFWFVHEPFGGGFGAFKFTLRGSPAQKTPKFRPFFGLGRFAAEIASALEPSRVNYP